MGETKSGTLMFHSETGTEGGWYAWEDMDHRHSGKKGDPCPWGEQYCPVEMGIHHSHHSYDGLHYLKNEDRLKVYDVDDTLLFDGPVKLLLRDDVYEEKLDEADMALVGGGLWVNQEPDVGVDRDTWASWFFSELRCEVTYD